MISITIFNQGLKQEREYSIRMLMDEFLELNYELKYHEHPTYILQHGNKKIIITDSFFSRFDKPEEYLKPENIPQQISFMDVAEWKTEQIPVLFGENKLQISEDHIQCGPDLFASSFFMLSRWEEYANKARDEHGRFPGNESLAFKHGFLNRPVVNEYADLLWQMLQKIGYEGERKKKRYKIVPTHDIDDLQFWTPSNKKRRCLNLAGDLVKRGNLKMAKKRWSSYLETKKNIEKDPYYTYSHLMDRAEKSGVQAQFYFMAGGETVYDRPYNLTSELFKDIISQVKERGHKIGFHGSYNTFNQPDLYKQEKEALEQTVDMEIAVGRQHYLRFENPGTMNIWEQTGITNDSTLYYSDYPGFRCGSCYVFPLFDIVNRKQTAVIEQPLLAMDGCFENMPVDKAVQLISEIKQRTKSHKGDFVFLVHNSSYGWMNNYSSFSKIEKVFYDA